MIEDARLRTHRTALVRCGVLHIKVEGPMGREAMRHPEVHVLVEAGLLVSWGMVSDLGHEMIVRISGTPEQVENVFRTWPEEVL